MITQVSGINGVVVKDPRRKAQSVRFKQHNNISYNGGYNEQYERQKENAMWTSLSIIAGCFLFLVGYIFFPRGDKAIKPAKMLHKLA